MADATFLAIQAHFEHGDYTIMLHYDSVSLLITSADVFNQTGFDQHITVGTYSFTIPNGTNANVPLSSRNQLMVDTFKGPRPPILIA